MTLCGDSIWRRKKTWIAKKKRASPKDIGPSRAQGESLGPRRGSSPSDDDACVRLRDCSLVPEARRVPCRRHRSPRLDAIYVVSFSFVFVAALARVPRRTRWLDVMDCGVKRQAACASWPRPDQSVDLFSVWRVAQACRDVQPTNAGTDLGLRRFDTRPSFQGQSHHFDVKHRWTYPGVEKSLWDLSNKAWTKIAVELRRRLPQAPDGKTNMLL